MKKKYDVSKVSRETLEKVCFTLLNSMNLQRTNGHLVTFDTSALGDACVQQLKEEADVTPRTKAEVNKDIVQALRFQLEGCNLLHSDNLFYRYVRMPNSSKSVEELVLKLLSEETSD